MSSVLYQSGLNYQATNPLRTEIRGLHRQVDELKWKLDVVMGAFDKMGGDAQEFIRDAFIAKQKEREATAASAAMTAQNQNQNVSSGAQQAAVYGSSIASLQAQLQQPPGTNRRY